MNFVVYLHWLYSECNGGLNVQLQLAKRLSEKGFKTKDLAMAKANEMMEKHLAKA